MALSPSTKRTLSSDSVGIRFYAVMVIWCLDLAVVMLFGWFNHCSSGAVYQRK